MAEESRPGIGVDAKGNAVVDPSVNVQALNEASVKRLDDLARAAEKLSNVKHGHAKEIIALNASHGKELREAESKRLDAIRAVDVAAASVIANQVTATADALRALVSTTATTLAAQSTATFDRMDGRLAQLERTSYEGSGRATVADPAIARMAEAVEALRTDRDKGQGREGLSTPLLMLVVASLAGVGGFIIQSLLGAG